MADPRFVDLMQFTKTQTHAIPPTLNPSAKPLDRKFVVCIIGASEGIGEHIAYAYAQAQVGTIVIASRRLPMLENVKAGIHKIDPHVVVDPATCDISSAESVSALADHVKSKFADLDAVVVNAGFAGPFVNKIHDSEPQAVQQALNINTLGTFFAAMYFVPLLLSSHNGQGGKTFVVVSSVAAAEVRSEFTLSVGYNVSKFAQARVVEFVEEQYGDQGILACAVHPGGVMTSMAKTYAPTALQEYLVDEIGLCGAVCVRLSRDAATLRWLSGRFLSSTWDFDEVLQRKQEIVDKDMLKFAMVLK